MQIEEMIRMVMHQTESSLTAEQVAGRVEAACNKYSLALLQTYIYQKAFPFNERYLFTTFVRQKLHR